MIFCSSVLTQPDLVKFQANCDSPPAVIEDKVNTYRNASGLDYPVNVGRNIAREAANSHFIFPSDIELYPNPGVNFIIVLCVQILKLQKRLYFLCFWNPHTKKLRIKRW